MIWPLAGGPEPLSSEQCNGLVDRGVVQKVLSRLGRRATEHIEDWQ